MSCGGYGDPGADFYQTILFLLLIIPPMFYTHLPPPSSSGTGTKGQLINYLQNLVLVF